MKNILKTFFVLVMLSFPLISKAAVYNIGPGQTYTTIGSAPWSSLVAGDVVNIYPKTAITGIVANSSNGTTITLNNSTESIPFGSTVWFSGLTTISPYVTCGMYGSGLYSTSLGGTNCSGNTVTINDPINIENGTTIYFTPPYFEKLILTAAGMSTSPIIVQGISDPITNAKPILDSHNATTGPNMSHTGSTEYHDAYGFVLFAKSKNELTWPKYLTLKNIRIQNGRAGLTGFAADAANPGADINTNDDDPYVYVANSGIRFENADNVIIEGLELVDNDNGLFGATNDDTVPAQFINNLTVKNCHFWHNGLGYSYHQSYLEGNKVIYEQNWYDKPGNGTFCSQLKDRSAGTIIRNNLFYPSIRVLDLIASQNGNSQLIPQTKFTIPAGGFASGSTNLVFDDDIANIHSGDAIGFLNAFTGVRIQSISSEIGNQTVLNFEYPYMMGGAFINQHFIIKDVAGQGCDGLNGEHVVLATNNEEATVTINYDSSACSYSSDTGYVYSGWGYPGSGLPEMPIVASVNSVTKTVTLNSPGLPMGLANGSIINVIHRSQNPYFETFVYGNIFDQDKNLYPFDVGALVHYGWDSSSGLDSVFDRAGSLYFYNNTAILRGYTNQTVIQSESNYDSPRLDNNLFYAENPSYYTIAARSHYAGLQTVGTYTGGNNQIVSTSGIGSNTCGGILANGWEACNHYYPINGSVNFFGFSAISATQAYPLGLLANRNYHLQENSSAIGAASTLPVAITSNSLGLNLTPNYEYGGLNRYTVNDIGAFEFSSGSQDTTSPSSPTGLSVI